MKRKCFKITESQYNVIRSMILSEDSTDSTNSSQSDDEQNKNVITKNSGITLGCGADNFAKNKTTLEKVGSVLPKKDKNVTVALEESFITTKREMLRQIKENSILIKVKDIL